MRGAFKFLASGAESPFTGFRWPAAGVWVSAAGEGEGSWLFACRPGDLPYWVDAELWRVELDGPVREGKYQISAPRARLGGRVEGWNDELRGRYARACTLRARVMALPTLPPGLKDRVERTEEPGEIAAAVRAAPRASSLAGYLGDAAALAQGGNPASASYVACMVAATLGEGQQAFEAERAWQAGWLSQHLALDGC